MTTYTTQTLETKTLSELVALYNEHSETPVKKFKDKPTAVRRVLATLPEEPALPEVTDAEFTALDLSLNYGTEQDQLADNFSNGGHEEFEAALGWKREAVAALIGSLEKKGLGHGDENDGNGHIFWLSELGVRTVFAEKAKGRQPLKPEAKKAPEAPAAKTAKRKSTRIMRFNFDAAETVKEIRDPNSLRGRVADLLKGEGATFEQIKQTVLEFDAWRGVEPKNVERRAYEVTRLLHYYVGYGLKHNVETGIIQLVAPKQK